MASEGKKRKLEEAVELTPRTYSFQRILGQGSYGTVYLASIIETDEVCAIKSIKPVRKMDNGEPGYTRDGPDREVQILKDLRGHPNIVDLMGAFISKSADGQKLNLVFEFLSDTLHRVIKHHNQLGKGIDPYYVKFYFYQLVRGTAYMHGRGYIHCDMKPQNLLLEGKSHGLRICDFGTARRMALREKRALYVCSRYFRAPEIILGSTTYNTAIDLWSVGLIFAELIIRQPLFTGRDGIDQLVEIIKVLGTPTSQDLKAMNPNYPSSFQFKPEVAGLPWKKVLKEWATPDAVELAAALVRFNPNSRMPPLQVMLHPYFDELRAANKPAHRILFNFLPEELAWCTEREREKLVPHWMSANGTA